MKKIVICLLSIIIFSCLWSCKARYPVIYRYLPDLYSIQYSEDTILSPARGKLIILLNDTILQYKKYYGGIGWSTEIRYYLDDNLMIVDSLDVFGRISNPEFTKSGFTYSKDSLVNNETGQIYHNTNSGLPYKR